MTDSDSSSKRRLAQRILGLVDLTNLDDACTETDVDLLCARAHGPHGNVAAVCIWPRFVARAVRRLEGTGIPVATVVNFPGGSDETCEVVALIGRCLADGAHEIDVVLPYRSFLAGRIDEVATTLDAVRAAVPSTHHVKVILETGELADPEFIRRASRLAIDHGADFIKTSTGKTKVSANPESARVMLEVIADSIRPVGLKPSGGIRTLDDAESYLHLADDIMGPTWVSAETFRFGASGLLDALEAELG